MATILQNHITSFVINACIIMRMMFMRLQSSITQDEKWIKMSREVMLCQTYCTLRKLQKVRWLQSMHYFELFSKYAVTYLNKHINVSAPLKLNKLMPNY